MSGYTERSLILGLDPDGEPIIIRTNADGTIGGATTIQNATVDSDVSDRDSRILGRVKLTSSGGLVIEPASEGTLADILAALSGLNVTVDNFPASQAVTGPLTNTQLRATSINVETELIQPLTNTELRASPVPVSFTADELGLTNAELRATAVNVETELIQPLTNTELRASRVPVDIDVSGSRFAEILKFQPKLGEEIRRDETTTDDYHGVALDGSSTADTVWDVVRFYKTAGLITRVRARFDISWDNRTTGW